MRLLPAALVLLLAVPLAQSNDATLLGPWTVTVPSHNGEVVTQTVPLGDYSIVASGRYYYNVNAGTAYYADAEYSWKPGYTCVNLSNDQLDLKVSWPGHTLSSWGSCRSSHTYAKAYHCGLVACDLKFWIYDTYASDNSGVLTVTITKTG